MKGVWNGPTSQYGFLMVAFDSAAKAGQRVSLLEWQNGLSCRSPPEHLSEKNSLIQFIHLPLPYPCPKSQIPPLVFILQPLLTPPIIPPRLAKSQFRSDLVRTDKFLVLVNDWAAEARFKYDNRGEDETWTDLDETDFGIAWPLANFRCYCCANGSIFSCGVPLRNRRLTDLKTPYPYFAIGNCEAHDMIDERLGFPCALGNAENMCEEFFDHKEVWLRGEGGVKGENWSRAFEAVAGKMEFRHSVYCAESISDHSMGRGNIGGGRRVHGIVRTILQVHFHSRPIGSLAHPYVKILALSCLEEEDIVAIVQFRQFIQLIELGFRVELRIFATVG